MKFCRDCRMLWPSEALFCGRCKKSFGGRRCDSGHLSPKTASFCTTCGSRKLSQAARHSAVSAPVRVVAWIVGLVLVKVILANLWTIIGIALSIIGSLLSFVIGNSIGLVLGRLIHTAAVLALIWLAFRMIRGKNSAITKGVERLGGRVLVAVGRAMLQLGSAFFRWITTRSSDSPKGGRS